MQYYDDYIESLDLDKTENIILLFEYLRGDTILTKEYVKERIDKILYLKHFKQIVQIVKKKSHFSHAQINEILLLLDKNTISNGFYYYFFVPEVGWKRNCNIEKTLKCYTITKEELRKGIIKFRGIALLFYGNFRFAHKDLRELTLEQIIKKTNEISKNHLMLKEQYFERPSKALDISRIKREDTWLTGYLSFQDLIEDKKLLLGMSKKLHPKNYSTIIKNHPLEKYKLKQEDIDNKIDTIDDEFIIENESKLDDLLHNNYELYSYRAEVLKKTKINTDIYLTWDFMDVYVATSMRNKWEFESIYEFIDKVFYKSELNQYNLRFFDPTQSYTNDRLNKGFIESLMLKRANLTIYQVQESDTLGKDSELAATLAQGKPVIAYIPIIEEKDIQSYAKKIESRPINYFYKRYLAYKSENNIYDKNTFEILVKFFDENNIKKVEKLFDDKLHKYLLKTHLLTDKSYDDSFKKVNNSDFKKICLYIAIVESTSYEKRANVLKDSHPLAMQVNLSSGVANGILVARTYEECVKLVIGLLTNKLKFDIKCDVKFDDECDDDDNLNDYIELENNCMTKLIEKITDCPFRAVTGHHKITNSFWNFYLKKGGNNV